MKNLRKDAFGIFDAALKAADPVECVKRNLRFEDPKIWIEDWQYDTSEVSKIYVLALGKAAVPMAKGIREILRDRISIGFANTKYGHGGTVEGIEVNECGHPIPDENGVIGAERIIALAREADESTLVICLISGGGSALMPAPAEGITLGEKQKTTGLLLKCGATINEMNAIRKHLSKAKGGQLAEIARPAYVASLILSDVVGDKLDVIASGPTVPDSSTFGDCIEILKKYEIPEAVPENVMKRIEAGFRGEIPETPKVPYARCQNVIIGSNRLALEAASEKARSFGYNVLLLSSQIEGETREVAKVHTAIAKEIVSSGEPLRRPACVISGGETTVTIEGDGLGGRNQEFALASAMEISGIEGVLIFSAGTDGTDGPTDAAGALADGSTVSRALELGISPKDFLADNDSYNFFKALGDLVITGPTGTNVMDVRIVLVV